MALRIKPIRIRVTIQSFPSYAALSWVLKLFEQQFLQYVKLEECYILLKVVARIANNLYAAFLCIEGINECTAKENEQKIRKTLTLKEGIKWNDGICLCSEETVKGFELPSGFWDKHAHTHMCTDTLGRDLQSVSLLQNRTQPIPISEYVWTSSLSPADLHQAFMAGTPCFHNLKVAKCTVFSMRK